MPKLLSGIAVPLYLLKNSFFPVVTIYDIAKAAKTSPASVSRVINARGGVKEETVLRIKRAMETLNFQPRWKAIDRDRFLVFVPEHGRVFDSGYVARIMSGIADAAFSAGFGLQLRPFSSQGREVSDLRQLYMQEAVSGCIIISLFQGYALPARLDLAGLPHVVVGHKREDDNIHQVCSTILMLENQRRSSCSLWASENCDGFL